MEAMGTMESTLSAVERGFGTRCRIDAKSCVRARHQASTCAACVSVCPQGAISFPGGIPTVANTLCTGCGACAAVCPTQAAEPVGFADEAIRAAIDHIAPGDQLLFICAESLRQAGSPLPSEPLAKRHKLTSGQHVTVVTLPCLVRLDEAQLLHGAVAGAASMTLLCASCKDCQVAQNEETIQETMAIYRHLSQCWDVHVPVHRVSDPELIGVFANRYRATEAQQPDRRDAFSQIAEEVKQLATNMALASAKDALAKALPQDEGKPSLAQILGFAHGAMPQRPTNRNEALLNDLFVLEESGGTAAAEPCNQPADNEPGPSDSANQPSAAPSTEPVEYDHFGKVTISDACNDCGICAKFCPTGALHLVGEPKQAPKMGLPTPESADPLLEFRCCDCSGCELCADICPQHAITISHSLSHDELFALEPVCLRGNDEASC